MATDAQRHSDLDSVPWQLWIIIVLLGLEGIGNVFLILNEPMAVTWLLAKILYITGLIKRWRFVYVLFLVVASIHVLAFALSVPVAALLNLLMIVLALTQWQRFFPRSTSAVQID